MIFLRKHNLLFLKARKVAGTSFEIALSRFAGPDDIITPIAPDDEAIRRQRGFAGPRNYRKGLFELGGRDLLKLAARRRLPQKFYNHISAAEARQRLGAETFDRAFKVAIVRNPFDMLVSLYHYERKGQGAESRLAPWIRQNPAYLNINDEQYLIDGADVIDHYIQFEDLPGGTRALEEIKPGLAGLAELLASITAKSGVRPRGATAGATFAAEPDLAAAVRFFNRRIIEKFGYDCG